MKLDFKKIGSTPKRVEASYEGLKLSGDIKKGKDNLTDFKGRLSNELRVVCSRCGEEFLLPVDEEIFLKFSDGIYRGFDEEADIVEFYDGKIDFDEVIASEMESIKLDYHICNKCKGERDGSTKETSE